MNVRILLSFLAPILEVKWLAGYRSQILGALYAITVLLQGFGLLDNYWDQAEMLKGAVVGFMPMTMAAKITKATRAAEDAKKAVVTENGPPSPQ